MPNEIIEDVEVLESARASLDRLAAFLNNEETDDEALATARQLEAMITLVVDSLAQRLLSRE